jgi:hypothetical protein
LFIEHLPLLNDGFWRALPGFSWACWLYVLATLWLTTCGSPLKPAPAGGLRLPAGKHASILTYFQTIVNKKMKKKFFFFGHPREACPYMIWGQELI